MKLVQIAGYLGSGKTTLIISLGRRLSQEGKKVAILVNDIGSIPVDGKVMEEFGLAVKDIGGGCICCQVAGSMIQTLKVLAKNLEPDVVIIEPTGMAVPSSIKEVVSAGAVKIGVVLGPVIVLFDTTRVDKLMGLDPVKRLISNQLKDADLIALSKADAASEEDIEKASKAVRQFNDRAGLLRLSTHTEEGFPEILRAVEEVTVSR